MFITSLCTSMQHQACAYGTGTQSHVMSCPQDQEGALALVIPVGRKLTSSLATPPGSQPCFLSLLAGCWPLGS